MAMVKVTKQMLKTRSGEFDVESIHSLVLKELDISDLGCIGECTMLERLDLSRNDITKLYALAGLNSLTDLNLSANRISSLEGLQSLDNLKSLNLAGNLIGSIDALHCLSSLEKLDDLRLCDKVHDLTNPVCMNTTYKSDVTTVLPKLVTLDGERLTGRGSDLFKLCEELDTLLKENKSVDIKEAPWPPAPWIPPGFWEPSTQFEESSLADAEEQLEALLTECKRASQAADEKLQDALKNIQPKELTTE